jgi:hypothetical protein
VEPDDEDEPKNQINNKRGKRRRNVPERSWDVEPCDENEPTDRNNDRAENKSSKLGAQKAPMKESCNQDANDVHSCSDDIPG